ncbi:MAG: extracellular solute-binding protein [Candidatus Omnitrophota bacterium]
MPKWNYLKFWIMPNAGYDTSQMMEKEIEAFEKTHPNIKVDLYIIPWSQSWRKIITAAKSKQLPDVFQIGNTWTKTLTAINTLADITKRVHEDKLKDRFYATAWATCEVQNVNRIYALPWFVDIRMLFYRKDLFKKAGLHSEDLDKWESFEEVCRTLSSYDFGATKIGALGVSDLKDQGLVHDVAPWIWASGGDFLTEDGTGAAFHRGESLRGIKFYFDLMQKGYAPIFDRKVPGMPVYEFFSMGKYGMCFVGAFVVSYLIPGFFGGSIQPSSQDVIEKNGVTFFPAGPGGRYTFCGGSNLAISNYSPFQDEAWELLKFLTSNEVQKRHYQLSGALPSVTSAFNTLFNEGTEQQKVLMESCWKYGRSYLQVDFWASIEFVLTELFGKIIDSIKANAYNENFLMDEVNKAAEQVNHLLSL